MEYYFVQHFEHHAAKGTCTATKMRLTSCLEIIKGNNLGSKSKIFHNLRIAYINDRSKNELAQILLCMWLQTAQPSSGDAVTAVW